MAGTQTVTLDFGSTPLANEVFLIVDAAILPTHYIEAFVMGDATVDNDIEDHRHAAASWKLACLAQTGSFYLDVTCMVDLCSGTFSIRYVYA